MPTKAFPSGRYFEVDCAVNNTSLERRQGSLSLRLYQHKIVSDVDALIEAGNRRILIPLPTGGGKTVIAAELARKALARRQRVLILAHRRELIGQSAQKLHAAGLDFGIIAAGWPSRPGEPVQIASVQTLHLRAVRSATLSLPPADVAIVDEAHHAVAGSWQRIIGAYPEIIVIGLSATPCRGDGRGLGDMFEALVPCPGVPELIDGGFLVSTRVYAPSVPDLHGVRVERGDYNERQLAEKMDRPELTGDVVGHWHKLADRRPTAVFATSIAHAVHLRDEFARSGVVAEHLDGSTPVVERDAILARLAAGKTEVVCNCGVLTEGWDSPGVSCIVLARPTRSLALYRQVVGRGLRPAPGKSDCLILDHAGSTLEHGFVDEPIAWTLAPDRLAGRSPTGGGGINGNRSLTTCPECSAVRWQGRPCGACGWRPRPKATPIEVRDGELGEVHRDRSVRTNIPTATDKMLFYRQLLKIAQERGYSPGWASHKHKERFGGWPATRYATPAEPTHEVRSWVRSRIIAYAKGRAKAGAQ